MYESATPPIGLVGTGLELIAIRDCVLARLELLLP